MLTVGNREIVMILIGVTKVIESYIWMSFSDINGGIKEAELSRDYNFTALTN